MIKRFLPILLVFSLLFILIGCGGTEDPNSQAEDELALLDNHYNEIKTDIGNLNVTGHGDFVNMMVDQISFAQASIQELDEDYGDESEVINQCKEAWEKLIAMCIAYRDGIQNNDPATVATYALFEQEYQDLVNQIQTQINSQQ